MTGAVGPPMTSSVAVAARSLAFIPSVVQWLRVGLVFSGSADRIPEGEVCFLIIKKDVIIFL